MQSAGHPRRPGAASRRGLDAHEASRGAAGLVLALLPSWMPLPASWCISLARIAGCPFLPYSRRERCRGLSTPHPSPIASRLGGRAGQYLAAAVPRWATTSARRESSRGWVLALMVPPRGRARQRAVHRAELVDDGQCATDRSGIPNSISSFARTREPEAGPLAPWNAAPFASPRCWSMLQLVLTLCDLSAHGAALQSTIARCPLALVAVPHPWRRRAARAESASNLVLVAPHVLASRRGGRHVRPHPSSFQRWSSYSSRLCPFWKHTRSRPTAPSTPATGATRSLHCARGLRRRPPSSRGVARSLVCYTADGGHRLRYRKDRV